MSTASFELRVHSDREGRTRITLVDPAGKVHPPVVLTLHGEQALYRLMAHVRPEVRPAEVLETWEPRAATRGPSALGVWAADIAGHVARIDDAEAEEALTRWPL